MIQRLHSGDPFTRIQHQQLSQQVVRVTAPHNRLTPSPVAFHPFHAVLQLRLRSHVLVEAPPTDLHVVVRRLQLRPVVDRREAQDRKHLLALIGLRFSRSVERDLKGVAIGGGVHLVAAKQVAKVQHLRLSNPIVSTFAKMHPIAHMSTAGP